MFVKLHCEEGKDKLASFKDHSIEYGDYFGRSLE
jgi:hypothetical protein